MLVSSSVCLSCSDFGDYGQLTIDFSYEVTQNDYLRLFIVGTFFTFWVGFENTSRVLAPHRYYLLWVMSPLVTL